MTRAHAASSVAGSRRAAVTKAVDQIRAIETGEGVSRASLDAIRTVLRDLATRRELFPPEDFPIVKDEQEQDPMYLLSEDEDKRFALYMSCTQGEQVAPPHDHTTWVVIVGVEGEEYNTFYERADDGSIPGEGSLRVVGETVVRPGTGVCMMPDEIHHIETYGKDPTMHLHMYGLALDSLTGSVMYDLDEGTYRTITSKQNIRILH